MIDALSILLTHGLIMLAAWRMLARDDLDVEPETRGEEPEAKAEPAARPWLANQKYLSGKDQSKSKETGRDA